MPIAAPNRREVFQLAYLPHVVAAHFNALSLLDQAGRGASPRLSDAISRALSALPKRGPEVVSCVMQVERIMADHGTAPPPAPTLPDESTAWAEQVGNFVREALDPRRWDVVTKDRVDATALLADAANLVVYTMAQRIGDVEQTFRLAALTARLLEQEPAHPMLVAQHQRLQADLVRGRERLEGTLRDQASPAVRLGRLLPPAIQRVVDGILARPQTAQALELTLGVVVDAALQVERGAASRPFAEVVADAKVGKITPAALERAVVEHPSMRAALHERTLWLATDGDRPGFEVWRYVDGEVDWVVVDAAVPESTVHFGREQLSRLRLLADAVALEAAATAWSGVPLDSLVKYPAYRVLARGEPMRNLVWTDHGGRPFVAVFSTDDALDAFLAQKPDLGEVLERRWMPGALLFAALSRLDLGGFVLNPAGPGPSRIFNRGTLGALGLQCLPCHLRRSSRRRSRFASSALTRTKTTSSPATATASASPG